MASKVVKRRFVLTDGTSRFNLVWQTGETLPDFGAVPVLSARLAGHGYEWATGETRCPSCGRLFPIGADPKSHGASATNRIESALLTPDAILPFMMLGNVSIDTEASFAAVCPDCSELFAVNAKATSSEICATVENDCVSVRCPDDRVVRFHDDGTVTASERRRLGFPTVNAEEFAAVPRFVGVSKEAKDWPCLVLGIRAGDRSGGDTVDLLDLSLRRRFRGFGEAHIAEARKYITQPGVRQEVLNGLFSLPRDYDNQDGLVKMFRQSGLPDKPSVRKAAAARPAALALVAKYRLGGLCGDDPNLAVKLLRSPSVDAAWCSALLDGRGNIGGFVLLAATEEKPSYLIKQLLDANCAQLGKCVAAFDDLELDPYKRLLAYKLARKDYGLASVISKPGLLVAYAKSTKSIAIKYGDEASLQGEYNGYSFRLPRQTGRFASAGATLKNCLGEGYAERVALHHTLVFLVSKGNALVAAIEVNPKSMEILQMYAKANRKIKPTEDLGIAIALWAKDKGVVLHGYDFG